MVAQMATNAHKLSTHGWSKFENMVAQNVYNCTLIIQPWLEQILKYRVSNGYNCTQIVHQWLEQILKMVAHMATIAFKLSTYCWTHGLL